MNLIKAVEIYLSDCLSREQSDRTIESKKCALNCFLVWCASHKIRGIEAVEDVHLEQFRQYVRGLRNQFTGKELAPGTRRNHLTAVTVFFQRAYELRLIETNPASRFRLPKAHRPLPKGVLQPDEINAVCNQSLMYGDKGIRNRAIIEVYFATGIRRAELCSINIEDIHFKANVLMIRNGKGDKDRIIPIAERACYWIKVYLDRVRPKYATFESGSTLFLHERGCQLKPTQMSYLISTYHKLAGIQKPGACNLYRHTTATTMHDNGADIRVIQELLGHADISTTQVYTHVAIGKLCEVYRLTHPAANK